jgi:hypothetical protein
MVPSHLANTCSRQRARGAHSHDALRIQGRAAAQLAWGLHVHGRGASAVRRALRRRGPGQGGAG